MHRSWHAQAWTQVVTMPAAEHWSRHGRCRAPRCKGADKRRAPQMEPELKNMKPAHLSGLTWCFVDQTQPIATSWMDSLTAALLPTIPQQDIGVCRTL